MNYRAYIRSGHWQHITRAARKRAGYRCERWWCRVDNLPLDTHHLTYRNLGKERPSDVLVLCRRCHKLTHGRWLAALAWTVWSWAKWILRNQ